jgi:hypothetical protein
MAMHDTPYAGRDQNKGGCSFMKAVFSVLVGAAWVLAGSTAAAHHSFSAEFDINRPVQLTGKVTKLEWTNPHAWIWVDAKDAKGNVQNWAIELVGINDLMRRGWARDRVKIGDSISVDGFGAKSGANIGNAASVSLTDTGELLWKSTVRGDQRLPE